MKCPECNKLVEENWKICPHCRTKLTTVESLEKQDSPLQVYKNKVIWKIVQGEVARHIRESELVNFDQVNGLIIEEGVSAYIYVDGTRVAELSSGAYEFTSKEEIDKILNERVGGVVHSKYWEWIVALFKGKRVGDKVNPKDELKDMKSLEDILHYLRKDSVISIYLKLNKTFPLVFGVAENGAGFEPITVRTKLNDINVGLTMQLQVTDFNEFVPHYLVEKNYVTRQDIQKELANDIKALLHHQLESEIIDERGFNYELRTNIESELTNLNDLLYGVSVTRVVDISCDNADFERFRGLAKEIYIAEREMDYLRRTQEMKNRIVSFENDQKIHEARSTYELDKILRDINKDNLLSREEFRRFEQMLDAQRKIADAKTEWEVKSALNDLKRSEMVSDDEVDKIASQIQGGKIQRESINQILMIEAANREAQAKLDAEILLNAKTKEFYREQMISDAKTEDIIERIRAEREREAANDAMERLRKLREIQLEADRAELEIKRTDVMERKAQDYAHEQDMTSMTYKHEERMHEMDTAVEIHKADSREREALVRAEKESEAREREAAIYRGMEDRYDKMMDRMERVTLVGFAAANGKDFTGKNTQEKTISQEEKPIPDKKKETVYFIPFICGNTASFNLESLRALVVAGTIKSETIIRVNGQDWQAGTLTELSDLFVK